MKHEKAFFHRVYTAPFFSQLKLPAAFNLYDWNNITSVKQAIMCMMKFVHLSSPVAEPASAKENNCLNAAKACNLNDTCKKYRSAYISPCTSRVSTSEACNKRKCHKALRQFFDKVIKWVWLVSLFFLQLFCLEFIIIASTKQFIKLSNIEKRKCCSSWSLH